MKLGTINKLVITRKTENGYYLNDIHDNEVLLPNRYIQDFMKMDSKIAVFNILIQDNSNLICISI